MTRRGFAGLALGWCAIVMLFSVSPGSAESNWSTDPATGCNVWTEGQDPKASITWTGPCKDGLAEGQGTLKTFQDGKVVAEASGEWRQGKANGHGSWTANGVHYEGELRDDEMNGRGVLTYRSGTRYEGEFRDDKPNGRGVIAYANGDRYEGEVRDGNADGRGTKLFARGNRYEGEFRGGQFDGNGVFTWTSGNRYEGQWRNGKQEGHGILAYKSGSKYDGEWRDGKEEGNGTYTWANGQRYEGEWRAGEANGSGVLATEAGTFRGAWKNGCLKVDGRFVAAIERDPTTCADDL